MTNDTMAHRNVDVRKNAVTVTGLSIGAPVTFDDRSSATGPLAAASSDDTRTVGGRSGTISGNPMIQTDSTGMRGKAESTPAGTPSQNSRMARPNAPATRKNTARLTSPRLDNWPHRAIAATATPMAMAITP